MNGNRVIAMQSATSSNSHPHSSSLADFQGNNRPECLVPGNRRFGDDESANLWSPCSNCSSSDENNSPTALNSINWDKPALEDKSVDFGWSTSQVKNDRRPHKTIDKRSKRTAENKPSGYVDVRAGEPKDIVTLSKPSPKRDKHSTQTSNGVCNSIDPSSTVSSENRLQETTESSECDELQDMTESYGSFRSEEEIQKEREDLRNVAWFQAGIPREIALEVLAEKPEGSFIVRESTTKPGCYALSLRVPPGKNPSGIAHYLILQTNKGYKIKGFTKEFSSLSALITHHSVMPELLPCPLSLSRVSTRDAEHEFEETEQKTCDIFADIHWLMTDLEL